jgi:phosphatidylserine/phosphatidylglycerophosphate/cardiolipin synthase-like enzyme
MSGSSALTSSVSSPAPGEAVGAAAPELLAGGTAAFSRILERIRGAKRSILIRCFDWRDDDTGKLVARHLLDAADRGVQVSVLKDRVGQTYEYLEGARASFFHKEIDFLTRLQTWCLMAGYGRWGSFRQRESELASAMLRHQNVNVTRHEKRFDHSKLYLFDDDVLVLGGMGIGDDFRCVNVDFMVEVRDRQAVQRFGERYLGRVAFDPERPLDYLLHSFRAKAERSLLDDRLRLIREAKHRLTIEMAYLGDPRCTNALVAAVERGIQVTLLTSRSANIIADLNLHTCDQLLRRTGDPEHLRIVLHPRMVHGKAIVADGERVDIGSANFTLLSHGAYEEVNLYCRNRGFAADVERAILMDADDGERARRPLRYRRAYAAVELALSHYHGGKARERNGNAHPTAQRKPGASGGYEHEG